MNQGALLDMKISYDSDVDILSIILAAKKALRSEELLPGIVVDFDADQVVVGFEIWNASQCVDLSQVNVAISQLLGVS